MTIPHDLLDLGSAGNTHISQRSVIELRQCRDGVPDLPFPAPMSPERSGRAVNRCRQIPVPWRRRIERRTAAKSDALRQHLGPMRVPGHGRRRDFQDAAGIPFFLREWPEAESPRSDTPPCHMRRSPPRKRPTPTSKATSARSRFSRSSIPPSGWTPAIPTSKPGFGGPCRNHPTAQYGSLRPYACAIQRNRSKFETRASSA